MRGELIMAATAKYPMTAKVAAAKKAAAYASDPLNLTKMPLKDAPSDFKSRIAVQKLVKSHERVNGNGDVTSGTGQTHAKLREGTIPRLVRTGRLNSTDLQAINEIEAVYLYISAKLWVRGYEIKERSSGSTGDDKPTWLDDAYKKRFCPWRNEMSVRRKTRGDNTSEVVFALIIDGITAADVDAQFHWRKGNAVDVFVTGIRKYAQMAGWVS